jgi:hypothetical protein
MDINLIVREQVRERLQQILTVIVLPPPVIIPFKTQSEPDLGISHEYDQNPRRRRLGSRQTAID